jgi:hypothetical protein
MSRAVTADHILFDECIEAFRKRKENVNPHFKGDGKSFILTSFEITNNWDLGICTVSSSEKVSLPGAQSAFISTVSNPEWVGTHNPHLFGIALSTIISFITLRNCKSTRDGYLSRSEKLTENQLFELAIINPILTAGPGYVHSVLSKKKEQSICLETNNFINLLQNIEYKNYLKLMQSIRMINLSIISKRDDFGLAYLLCVSGIETIAQVAIKRDKVKVKEPQENQWKIKAEKDPIIKELYDVYKKSRGNNQYLKERYIRFILNFAPPKKWKEFVSHPMEDLADYLKEISPSHNTENLIQKNWFEKYPEDLEDTQINEILADSYKHRSFFIHQGKQPPHKDPNSSINRFFQEFRDYSNFESKEILLPNYNLIVSIAKHSIINWAEEKNKN